VAKASNEGLPKVLGKIDERDYDGGHPRYQAGGPGKQENPTTYAATLLTGLISTTD
jgi:hypothetical protein